MVGTLRSGGCATCRQRKKKCGEERPGCVACVKNGWICPGYAKTWKFVGENEQLASHYRQKKYLFELDKPEPQSHTSEYETVVWHTKGGSPPPPDQYGGVIPRVIQSALDKHALLLCSILSDPRSQSLFSLPAFSNFFTQIPVRLGHNPALDVVIPCLCGIYKDFLSGQPASSWTIQQYGKSLSVLQACVRDAELRRQSETICASIILQLCELMLNSDNGSWNNLSRGSQLLIEDAGPDRFRDGFNRALLESQRPLFIVQDVSNGRECFLSRPEWRALPPLSIEKECSQANPPTYVFRSELADYLVDLPGLVITASRRLQKANNKRQTARNEALEQIAEAIQVMKRKMEYWYTERVVPHLATARNEVLSPEPPRLRYIYTDFLLGVVDCVVNSVLARLEVLSLRLHQALTGDISPTDAAEVVARLQGRQVVAQAAFAFVQGESGVAAKPLEFGLRQLVAAS